MAKPFTFGELGEPPRSPRRRISWRSIVVVVAGLVAAAPLALSTLYDLPAELFALTPMALWVGVWFLFRQLDAPAPDQPPPPRRDDPPPDPRPRPRAPGSPRPTRRTRRTEVVA